MTVCFVFTCSRPEPNWMHGLVWPEVENVSNRFWGLLHRTATDKNGGKVIDGWCTLSSQARMWQSFCTNMAAYDKSIFVCTYTLCYNRSSLIEVKNKNIDFQFEPLLPSAFIDVFSDFATVDSVRVLYILNELAPTWCRCLMSSYEKVPQQLFEFRSTVELLFSNSWHDRLVPNARGHITRAVTNIPFSHHVTRLLSTCVLHIFAHFQPFGTKKANDHVAFIQP